MIQARHTFQTMAIDSKSPLSVSLHSSQTGVDKGIFIFEHPTRSQRPVEQSIKLKDKPWKSIGTTEYLKWSGLKRDKWIFVIR